MGGAVVEVRVAEGDGVLAGDTLLVVSAMKMEAVVDRAVRRRRSSRVLPLQPGDAVAAGQVVAVIAPGDVARRRARRRPREDTWLPVLDEVAELQGIAAARFAPGSTTPASCASAAAAS